MESKYQGIKFKIERDNKEIIRDTRLSNLEYWCKIFHKLGLAPEYDGGSYGNLSFRTKENNNEFIITGSCIGLKDNLTEDCFVKVVSCDLENKIIHTQGNRNPSSESMLHYSIYNARKDINAIFHGHCKIITEKISQLDISETKNEVPYGTIELVNEVLAILPNNFFLQMKNHGFLSLGKTLTEAGNLALEKYNFAKLFRNTNF
jgi:ribulose-5-phosphate 4-epimerase/fuculose-1-phosphate aldolase